MQNNQPTFSVITPVYNRATLIGRAIESVLKQAFNDFELIIVDDGSTDNTKEAVTGIKDARIRYVRQEHKGANPARNKGCAESRGKYIIFLDSDDEALPQWLECFKRAFGQKDAGIVCCGQTRITEHEGRTSKEIRLPGSGGLFIQGGVYAIRRELFDETGGFVEDLPVLQNTEFSIRLIPLCLQKGWKIINIYEPLVIYYTRHAKDAKLYEQKNADYLKSIEYMFSRHAEVFARDPKRKARYLAIAGVCAARIKKYEEAGRYFRQAIASQPGYYKHYMRLLSVIALPGIVRRLWLRQYKDFQER